MWGGRDTGMARPAVLVAILPAILALGGCASNAGQQADGRPQFGTVFAQPIALLMVDYDANRDHETSLDEVKAGAAASFIQADADHSGGLRPLEVAAWAQGALGTRNDALTSFSFDENADGSIDPKEFEDAILGAFKRLDANDDGILKRSELVREAGARGERRGGAGETRERPGDGPGRR